MTTLDLSQHRAELELIFERQPAVVLAILFGSQARGAAGPLSDVDVAVLLDGEADAERRLELRLQLMADLAAALGAADLDVAVLNEATAALRYRVLRDGLILYYRDDDKFVAFRVQTVAEYLDFEPILKRHEKALLDKAGRGELLSGYDPHRGALERYRRLRPRLTAASESDL
jgi:predicted nucleotidyltransferase